MTDRPYTDRELAELRRLEDLDVELQEQLERQETRHAEWEFSSTARPVVPITWWKS